MTITAPSQFASLASSPLGFSEKDFSTILLNWYRQNNTPLPWRMQWSKYKDPFHVWVSEIMLQQTVIAAVIPIYVKFCKTYPTLADFAKASEEEVRSAVRGLGYYRRFALLHRACCELYETFGEQEIHWPQGASQWSQLPGVGPYTSAAIASITQNEPVPVVDGNVERVFSRLFDIRLPIDTKGLKETVRTLSAKLIPTDHPGDYNQGLMELGQMVCRPINPKCTECPVSSFCGSFHNNSTALAPGAKSPKTFVLVSLKLTILRHPKTNQIGLVRRPGDARFLRGTLGFYTERLWDDGLLRPEGSYLIVLRQHNKELGVIRHSITHHKISAQVVVVDQEKPSPGVEWFPADRVEELLISNLDRKAFFKLRS